MERLSGQSGSKLQTEEPQVTADEVSRLKTDNVGLKRKVDKLTAEVKTLNSDLSSLASRVTDLENP